MENNRKSIKIEHCDFDKKNFWFNPKVSSTVKQLGNSNIQYRILLCQRAVLANVQFNCFQLSQLIRLKLGDYRL